MDVRPLHDLQLSAQAPECAEFVFDDGARWIAFDPTESDCALCENFRAEIRRRIKAGEPTTGTLCVISKGTDQNGK